MSTHKSFASLSGSMLARKTAVRPAALLAGSNDLDWNAPLVTLDSAVAEPIAQGPIAPVTPTSVQAAPAAPAPEPASEPLLAAKPASAKVVPLVRPATAPSRPAGLRPLPVRRTRMAAFTLRLDPDRHLLLRLACALRARSGQSLVTAAVDRLLAEMPEVDVLAEQIRASSSIVRPLRETKP